RDQRIEYSEAYAFISAANRGVENARARLAVVARPPDADRHAALIDWSKSRLSKTARITRIPASRGLVEVEDGLGRRGASARCEPGFLTDLLVPAGTTLYVHTRDSEAQIEPEPGQVIDFSSLSMGGRTSRVRGALDASMRRGLFSMEFGPRYYAGFI